MLIHFYLSICLFILWVGVLSFSSSGRVGTFPRRVARGAVCRAKAPEGICRCLTAVDYKSPVKISEKVIIDDTQQGFNGIRCYKNYAPTLRASRYGLKTTDGIRIRKLTPLECWRLMGFDDEDFYKAQASGVSNSQLYKQAGNSIVVDVLEKIFKNL